MDDVLQSLAQAMAKKRQEAGQTDMTQADIDAGNQAINEYDMNKTGAQLGNDLLAAGKDNKDNYDVYGLPKQDNVMTFSPTDPAAAKAAGTLMGVPNPTPALATQSPNLVDKVTNAMKASRSPSNSEDDSEEEESPSSKLTLPAAPAPDTNKDGAYGADLNDAALAAAQKKANYNRMIGNMVNVGDMFASGLSKGASKYSASGDSIINQADQGVKDIGVRRDAMDKDTARQVNIIKLASEKDKADPNSEISKLYRDVMSKMGMEVSDKATAASVNEMFPAVERYLANKLTRETQAQNRADARDAKATDKQNQAYNKLITASESFRGDKATQQADVDLLNISKAKELIGNMANADKLTPQQIGLLTSEVAKIAKGGTPDKEEFKLLNPHTMRGALGEMFSKFANTPTAANAGAFVKVYNDYLSGLEKTSKQRLSDKFSRLGEAMKPQISEDAYNLYKKQYVDKYAPEQKSPEPQSSGKVRVTNGSETLEVDASDLKHALADGYKQVN